VALAESGAADGPWACERARATAIRLSRQRHPEENNMTLSTFVAAVGSIEFLALLAVVVALRADHRRAVPLRLARRPLAPRATSLAPKAVLAPTPMRKAA
jgi:hypothetical protein